MSTLRYSMIFTRLSTFCLLIGITAPGCDTDSPGNPDADIETSELMEMSEVADGPLDVPPDLAECPERPEPGRVCCRDNVRRQPVCEEGMLVCPEGYGWTAEFECVGRPDVVDLDMGASCDACGFDEVCVHQDGSCGQSGQSIARCEPIPFECSGEVDAVCGCDGLVYNNPCYAQSNRVDIWVDGPCEPPPGRFACGPRFCQQVGEYCEVATDAEGANTWTCRTLPDVCFLGPTVTCDCLTDETCGDSCLALPDGSFQLTCQ